MPPLIPASEFAEYTAKHGIPVVDWSISSCDDGAPVAASPRRSMTPGVVGASPQRSNEAAAELEVEAKVESRVASDAPDPTGQTEHHDPAEWQAWYNTSPTYVY